MPFLLNRYYYVLTIMKSQMQYLIWSSIVAQLEKADKVKTPYYNMAFGKMKLNEPLSNQSNER